VRFPENVSAVARDVIVESVGGEGMSERRVAGHHDKEDDSCSKEIDNLTLIRSFLVKLRSHVHLSSEFSVKLATSVTTFSRSSEAEVSNLDVEILSDEHVLGLQISVGNALRVHVMESREHLSEVVATNFFR